MEKHKRISKFSFPPSLSLFPALFSFIFHFTLISISAVLLHVTFSFMFTLSAALIAISNTAGKSGSRSDIPLLYSYGPDHYFSTVNYYPTFCFKFFSQRLTFFPFIYFHLFCFSSLSAIRMHQNHVFKRTKKKNTAQTTLHCNSQQISRENTKSKKKFLLRNTPRERNRTRQKNRWEKIGRKKYILFDK